MDSQQAAARVEAACNDLYDILSHSVQKWVKKSARCALDSLSGVVDYLLDRAKGGTE